jgi:hypothetical protein
MNIIYWGIEVIEEKLNKYVKRKIELKRMINRDRKL